MTVLPKAGKRIRNFTLVYGLALLLWMSVEDNRTLPVALFGIGLGLLLVVVWVLRQFGGKVIERRFVIFGAALFGAVSGFSAVIATTTLMFFKTAMHAHVFPDYPPAQMLAMLERIPTWSLVGLLFGISAGLLWFVWVSGENRLPSSVSE